jgi:hypothetical protein
MDSIYTRGDRPVLSNWAYENYLYWLGALMLYYKVFGDGPAIGGQLDGEIRQDIRGEFRAREIRVGRVMKGFTSLSKLRGIG